MITPWPAEPDRMTASNRETIERLGDVAVSGLAATEPAALAAAGGELPLDDWL